MPPKTPYNQNNSAELWLLKFDLEQVRGPYSTDAVKKMISEGICTGQEQIATYPSGDWVPLTKQIEFYESLLESLENPTERDEKKTIKMEAETVIKDIKEIDQGGAPNLLPDQFDSSESPSQSDDAEKTSAVAIQNLSDLNNLLQSQEPAKTATANSMSSINQAMAKITKQQDAELKRQILETESFKAQARKKLFPVLVGAIAVIALFIGFNFLNSEDTAATESWVLQAPKKSDGALSDAEVKDLKIKAIAEIRKGRLDRLPAAQANLVEALNGKSSDLESMGLLCAVHNLMWPYTKQSAVDIKAVTTMAQKSRSVDPISVYSDQCQSVFLLIKGQTTDAVAVISRASSNGERSAPVLLPFLYLSRAEILEDSENYLSAESYYEEAARLFPDWLWPQFGLARMQFKTDKSDKAQATYAQILEKDPKSKAAMYGSAQIYFKSGQLDKAQELFEEGFSLKQTLPRNFHIDALRDYLNILSQKNDKDKMLEVAQFGLKISPKNKTLKDLVISLGGEISDYKDAEVAELVIIGDQYFRKSDYTAAQAQYRAAFTLDGKNVNLCLKIARSLWKLSQAREALSWLDKAIEIDRKYIVAYTTKADFLIQKFNFIDAEKTLEAARRINPNSYEIYKSYANLELKKNNLQAAYAHAMKAYKLYDADVELISLLADINTNYFYQLEANQAKPDLLQSTKEEAKKYASKAIDLEPSLPEAQISYAMYLNMSEGGLRAERYFSELIKNYPGTIEYRLGLARLYESEEKYKSALEQYMPIANLDPKNFEARVGIARSYKQMNEYDLAQKYYLEAAVLDINDSEPMVSLAEIQLERGISKRNAEELKRAYIKFEKVSQLNPNYPKIYYYMARSMIELNEYQRATDLLKQEKARNPNLSDSYMEQGFIYFKQRMYKECAAEYSAAANLRLTAEPFIQAAKCYRLNDEIDMSEFMLNSANKREPGNIDLMKEYGFFYQKKGDRSSSQRYFKMYLEHSPNAPDRNEIEKYLY